MHDPRTDLVELLAQRAYSERDVILSSGTPSRVYVDAKQVTYLPRGADLIGRVIWETVGPEGVVGIGGLTLGADAITAATIGAAFREGVELPGFIVRKESKRHGMEKV